MNPRLQGWFTSRGHDTALERAEGLAERLLPDRTPKRRMLVIINPYAASCVTSSPS